MNENPNNVDNMTGVDLGALVQREIGRQLYPPVAEIKFHLVKIAEFLN